MEIEGVWMMCSVCKFLSSEEHTARSQSREEVLYEINSLNYSLSYLSPAYWVYQRQEFDFIWRQSMEGMNLGWG